MNVPLAQDVEFLAHHGVKGQKWGVVKKDVPVGNTSSSTQTPQLNSLEKAVLAKVDPDGSQSVRLNAKFGPESTKTTPVKASKSAPPTEHHLTPGQKHAIVVGAKFAVAGLAVYGLYKVGQKGNESLLGIRDADPKFKEFMLTMNKTKLRANRGLSKDFVKHLSDEPVTLGVGSIVKRISTESETAIRPGGFYAAHKAEDVERYKAVLPIFWKQWGYTAKEGHIVNLEAVEEIRAPSPKKTFEMFSKFMGDPSWGDAPRARQALPKHALNWNDSNNSNTRAFFKKLQAEGYNAVVDMNDAGSIGDAPLRIFSGDSFKIKNVERLSAEAIKAAQNNILAVAHTIINFVQNIHHRSRKQKGEQMNYDQIGEFLEHQGLTDDQIDTYFEHHGVKGQKWGVRRAAARSAKGPDRFGNRNNKAGQRRIDNVKRVAHGKATMGQMLKAGLLQVPLADILSEGSLSGGAQKSLDRANRLKNKVKVGKRNATDILLRVQGYDIRELNYGR